MKMYIDNLGIEKVLFADKVNSLVLENKQRFRDVLNSVWKQSKGLDGDVTFIEEGKVLSFSKITSCIFNPYVIDYNNKKILNVVYKRLNAISEIELIEELSRVNSNIVCFLETLVSKDDLNYTFDLEADVSGILKLYDVKLFYEEETLLERIIVYMKLLNKVCNIRVFIFLNLEQFFSVDELQYILETSKYIGCFVIDIKAVDAEVEFVSGSTIIDNELCTINL